MESDRLDTIRTYLYKNGATNIHDLSKALKISLATVRRDLLKLEESGAVERFHGGARLAQGSNIEIGFDIRMKQNMSAKRAIARIAYDFIEKNTSVFLDAGTTVLQLANLLRIKPLPCLLFTNGFRVAQELFDVPPLRLNLIGGSLRVENASFVGPMAEQMLQTIWIDTLMLGITAIDRDGIIYSIDNEEAKLNATMMARSTKNILLLTPEKFAQRATFVVDKVKQDTILISSYGLADEWKKHVKNWGCKLIIADQHNEDQEHIICM